jgi:hypothetical protein
MLRRAIVIFLTFKCPRIPQAFKAKPAKSLRAQSQIPSVAEVCGKGNNWENKWDWMRRRQEARRRLRMKKLAAMGHAASLRKRKEKEKKISNEQIAIDRRSEN